MIGLLDSGIGGLTAARQITDALPEYNLIYFGDTARSPYDNRSPHLIRKTALEGLDFLATQGAKLIFITCHSISAVLKAEKTDIPMLDIISPTARQAAQQSKKGRIGLIGPRAVTENAVYESEIRAARPDAKLISIAAPLLPPLAEEAWLKRPESRRIIKKYLHYLKVRQMDTLIPASGHYAVLARIIQEKAGKRVCVIDPAAAAAGHLKTCLNGHPDLENSLPKNSRSRFYVSDLNDFYQKTAKLMFGRNIVLEDAGRVLSSLFRTNSGRQRLNIPGAYNPVTHDLIR